MFTRFTAFALLIGAACVAANNNGLILNATSSNCATGSVLGTFSSITLTPTDPVKGSPASLVGNGTFSAPVSGGSYSISVDFYGAELYTHSGKVCGVDDVSLPLGFGKIVVNGLKCPVSPSSPFSVGLDVILPTAAPSGPYVVQYSATDSSGKGLYCLEADFTLA